MKVRLHQVKQKRREEPAVKQEEESGDKMTHFPEQSITVSVEAAVSSPETPDDTLDKKPSQLFNGSSDLTLSAAKSDRGERQSDPTSKSESDSGQNAATTGRNNPEKSIPDSTNL